MRFWSPFADKKFLLSQNSEIKEKRLPILKINIRFLKKNGGLTQNYIRWGLVDTGAEVSAIPGFQLGLYHNQTPSIELKDPVAVSVRGIYGERPVASYLADVYLGGNKLKGIVCENCENLKTNNLCTSCGYNSDGKFRIAVIEDLYYPLIGMDILQSFIATLDPFRKTTNYVWRGSGKILSMFLKTFRGARLT